MSHADIITLPAVLSRIPDVVTHLPGLIKGTRMARTSDETRPLGLGVEFEAATQAHPEGVAVIGDGRELTYRQLNAWANRIADYLVASGLHKGDTIIVDLENRPELVATALACAKIGVCAALLNTSLRGKVLVHSFNLVQPKAAIIGAEQTASIQEVRDQLDLDGNFFWFADQDTLQTPGDAPDGYTNLATKIRDCSSQDPASTQQARLNDPLFHIYTSGTTGLPKAVVFNHGRWQKAFGGFGFASVRMGRNDRLYCTLPLYHATGMVVCWGSIIAARGGLVLARRFSATHFWEDIRRHRCTGFGYVGELCRYLHEQPQQPDDADNPVHTILGNGLRPSIWRNFKQRFGIKRVVEFYASSEGNAAFTNLFNFDNTVGFSPVPYAIIRYDKEKDQPERDANGYMVRAAKGEAGLLLGKITEQTPFDGYTDPEKTRKVILRDVFEKGDAWFDSGDMMRDIGFRHAQFVDRLGDTFRWKGENVSTTEVEQIMDGFHQIVESVVFGVQIPGTDGRAGMAQLRLNCSHDQLEGTELLSWLKKGLPSYAIPLFLRITAGGMETTSTFKHQKHKLQEQKYDLQQHDDPVYVLLPGETGYQAMTAAVQQGVEDGRYRF